MRLIDADKLKTWFPHGSDWEYPVNTNQYVSELIDEQPTVDAIPVQWVKQFIFLHPDSTAQMVELVDEWRREQDGR